MAGRVASATDHRRDRRHRSARASRFRSDSRQAWSRSSAVIRLSVGRGPVRSPSADRPSAPSARARGPQGRQGRRGAGAGVGHQRHRAARAHHGRLCPARGDSGLQRRQAWRQACGRTGATPARAVADHIRDAGLDTVLAGQIGVQRGMGHQRLFDQFRLRLHHAAHAGQKAQLFLGQVGRCGKLPRLGAQRRRASFQAGAADSGSGA